MIFVVIIGLKSPISSFSSPYIYIYIFNKLVYSTPISGFALFYCVFVINLLQRIVVSSIISFFVGFRIDSSYSKVRSNKVIISNPVHQNTAYL